MGKSRVFREANQLITTKKKTLCLLSITTVVWGKDKKLPFLPWAS